MFTLAICTLLALSDAWAGTSTPPIQPRPSSSLGGASGVGGGGGGGLTDTNNAHASVTNVRYQCVSTEAPAPTIAISATITNTGSTPRAYAPMIRLKTPGKCLEWAPNAAEVACLPSDPTGNPCPNAPCAKRKKDATVIYTADRLVIGSRQSATVTFSAHNMPINGSEVIVQNDAGITSGSGGSFLPCAL